MFWLFYCGIYCIFYRCFVCICVFCMSTYAVTYYSSPELDCDEMAGDRPR